MKWNREGDMGMVCEPYRVGKFYLDGCTLYGLWCGDRHIGYFNDFSEAKEAAALHARKSE